LGALLGAPGPATAAAQAGSISFAPARSFAVGGQPFVVAPGDLDGDHIPDLVVANLQSFSVSVLLGNGDGNFRPQHQYATAGQPIWVSVGDLNGDGKPDLAAANYSSNTISVLFGNGDGTFQPRSDLTVGSGPFAIAIADVSGDGKPDLAVANEFSNSVSVLLGNGDGSFSPHHDLDVGTSPIAVAVADLNRDGRSDLAVANYGSGTVSVLLGNGDGTFAAKTDFAVGRYPWSAALGDLNGDGKPDLAVANGEDTNVSVLLGNGDGSFGGRTIITTNPYPRGATLADLNGDTRLDLVVAGNTSASVSVLPGMGDGTFGTKLDFAVGNNPTSVAIGDLTGDGRLDLATADEGSNTVSVLIQENASASSSTALASSPNPTVFGQATVLTATVGPGAATGTVAFYDGTTFLGARALSAGTASLTIFSLTAGSHQLTANYGGDASHAGSTSPPYLHAAGAAGTMSALSSSVDPSLFMQAVSFTATVTAVPPGSGSPTGSVQFTIDDVNFGASVALVAGSATSASTSAVSVGAHEVRALYGGDDNFIASASTVLSQVVLPSNPIIVAVRDVPRDQGGRVFLTWRSALDRPGLMIVTGYRVWRRAPDPTAAAAARTGAGEPDARPPSPGADRAHGALGDERAQENFWEAIATLPAEQLVSYAYTAPTTQDSMADSNPYTAFFVTALTADPFVYLQSAPDSGYSVDNLSPPAPMPFVAIYGLSSTTLHWGASPAPDLREYHLYRGLSADFIPGPSHLVVATRDTGYVDAVQTAYYYKLAAVDIHGNSSRYALVAPNGPVAVLASLVSVEAAPDRIRLTWYAAGGPGLTATVYRRTAQSDWAALGTIEADGSGYLRYEDAAVQTGARYGYRLGIMDGAGEVFVAEVWAVAERQVFALEGIRPNPAAGNALTVFFSLPNGEPARLELLDVSGRCMVARDVGSPGPGPHALDLAAGRQIPPGIYLVRLSRQGNARTVRAAVLN